MCEKPTSMGITKKTNIPLIVINWWAIKVYDIPNNDREIKNSSFFKYLKSFFKHLKATIRSIIEDKWINLKRKTILENSKGKRKYSNLTLYLILDYYDNFLNSSVRAGRTSKRSPHIP